MRDKLLILITIAIFTIVVVFAQMNIANAYGVNCYCTYMGEGKVCWMECHANYEGDE